MVTQTDEESRVGNKSNTIPFLHILFAFFRIPPKKEAETEQTVFITVNISTYSMKDHVKRIPEPQQTTER